jgi:hypothetical protein
MSTITEYDILQKFTLLSDTAKQQVSDFIDEQIKSEQPPTKKLRPGGWIKEEIIIPDDFDEPLEDFKEYM